MTGGLEVEVEVGSSRGESVMAPKLHLFDDQEFSTICFRERDSRRSSFGIGRSCDEDEPVTGRTNQYFLWPQYNNPSADTGYSNR